MRSSALVATVVVAMGLAACATTAPQGLPPVAVMAKGETAPVGTMNEDAADDPAIWRNADNPSQSLIVATDKKAGLYVYGLDGGIKSFLDAGAVNNVALMEMADGSILVAASDRNDLANSHIAFFELDVASAQLTALGRSPSGPGEGYGMCLYGKDAVMALAVLKDGTLREYEIAENAPGEVPQMALTRELSVPSQPEGCAFDERNGTLYVGEENAGIWRFAAGATTGEIVAPIDNQYLVADVEGLAIATIGTQGGYLIASSQGDNAYAVFSLPEITPLGRFRIAEGAFGSTEETDGIELDTGAFGPDYPAGLFIAQDGQNGDAAQNFKLVSWADVKAALGLD